MASKLNLIKSAGLFLKSSIKGSLSDKNSKNYTITELFKSCFAEISCSVALTGLTYTFSTPISQSSLKVTSSTIIITNILFKSVATYLQHRSLQITDKTFQDIEKKKILYSMGETLHWLASFNFALLFAMTGSILIHEGGHALAALLMYKNPLPQISVSSLFEGQTSWIDRNFSGLGTMLGKYKVKFLCCLSGPFAIVLAITAATLVAIKIQKTHSNLSRYLCISALFSLIYHTRYALSALASTQDISHDFVQLWRHGLHPVVAAGLMIGFPLVIAIVYLRSQKARAKP